MGTHLHQALRTLCFNTQWKYAVFWKLQHRARMMLTWEDAYYDSHMQHDPPESTSWMGGNLSDWLSHDPLWLAVAKMSYHVYSLGEGVIGQVAVTGKHVWIFADKYITTSCSPFEHCDGWQAQFSAGIKTVVVVAIGPYGVVQLGAQNKILEDLMLVNHVRDSFFALQDSSIGCTPSLMHCTMNSSLCPSDISTRCSCSGNFHDCISNLGRPASKTIIRSPTFSSTEKPADCSYIVPSPGDLPKKTVEAISKDRRLELSTSRGDESANILQSRPESFLSEPHQQVQTKLHIDRCEGETSCSGHLGVSLEDHDTPSACNFFTLPADDSGVDAACLHSNVLNSAPCSNQNGVLCMPGPLDMQIQKVLENIDIQTESNIDTLNKPLMFSAGCELYEVLGPAFQKQNFYSDWETEKSVTETTIEIPEGMDSSSLLTADSSSEHLLEAVVANVCRSGTDTISEKSHCKSGKSLLTTEKIPQPSCDTRTVGSAGYSFDQSLVEKDTLHCLSSEACGVSSSKVFSSRSQGTFSEQLDGTQEPPKVNKKRARPGESSRPRPRDRQLIQDRIKELRELVPSGSKCSIDSLLERTIKHMLFMQSITKHAEKLNKCTKSKLRDKETVVRGLSNYDQGSSWAMELGNHLNVFPIMVENINTNGQMLIEMFCDECSQFLELAEAIRSLGLAILKGVTEACGDKTRICFVVEGRNNRSMHRMDILWSLVQILQPKTAV